MTTKKELFTRADVDALVATANETAAPERRVHPTLVSDVVERAYVASAGLGVDERNQAIHEAVVTYVDAMTKGIVASGLSNYTDLLPPAHPYSTAPTEWTEDDIRPLRAAWIAADVEIAEENRPVVAAAFAHPQGSPEALHAEIRLLALTASGDVPSRISSYGQVIVASASSGRSLSKNEMQDLYRASRENLLDIVQAQTALTASGSNLYDHDGKLPRMIYRGDSVADIKRHLERSESYKASLANMDADLSSADPYAQFAQEQFRLFQANLDTLMDSPTPIDLRATAASAVEPYDVTGDAAKAIVAGASADYVFGILERDNELWAEDVENYFADTVGSMDKFGTVYEAIVDVDGEAYNYASLSDVLPASK